MTRDGAFIGIAHHNGWAIMVTASSCGTLIDRRRVELVDAGLPKQPHHHEAQSLPLDEALALVERVRASTSRCAVSCLDELAAGVPVSIAGVAICECPELPTTVAERMYDYWAQPTLLLIVFGTSTPVMIW